MVLPWYVHGVELSLTHWQSLPVAGTNPKSGHCRHDNCTTKGGDDREERLLYISTGDVAESIRDAECGSVVVDTSSCSSSISPSYWKRGRVE